MAKTQARLDSAQAAADFIENRRWRMIGIDGIDGVGKTTLANKISILTGLPAFSVDEYVERNKEAYVDFVDYERLGLDLREADSFIIEGVCLLAALLRLGFVLDGLLYIKRIRHGYWADENECVFPDGVEKSVRDANTLVQEMENAVASSSRRQPESMKPLSLSAEIMRYHAQYTPHESADAIFTRHDR